MGQCVVTTELSELEKEFRGSWTAYNPARFSDYLDRAQTADRLELLVRLVSAELEFLYTPPTRAAVEEDDERVRPSLGLFAARFPELLENQAVLFRLAVLEYALRLKHDSQTPDPESYLAFCDRSQDRLLNLLRLTENTLPGLRPHAHADSANASDSTVTEASEKSIQLAPLPNNLGCFLLLRDIGQGGMGYVHSAIDLRNTAPVAVKVMRRNDPWSISRFIEEFSWLSQLNHPNVVKLYDAFAEGNLRYFSMELVEGRSIHSWFQRKSDTHSDPDKLLWPVLGQAASAIHFLHDHGVLHCDIKCSNVMITSRGRAVVLDLGLATREGHSLPGVGTLQYMAPEVIHGGDHSRASDWYSFGMLIYEVLAQEQFPELLRKSAEHPEANCQVDLETLRDKLRHRDKRLVELCCDLLNPDPRLRPRGSDIVSRLGGKQLDEEVYHTFAGRDETLAKLDQALADSRESLTKFVVLRGESGIGKTTVLQHWLKRLNKGDLQLKVRCYQQDHTPLRLLNHFVQELVKVLSGLPNSSWWPLLEPRFHDIKQAFPQILRAIDEGYSIRSRPQSSTPVNVLRSRGLQQLTAFLIDLSQSRRLLIAIDDAQWADLESLRWFMATTQSDEFRGLTLAVDQSVQALVQSTLDEQSPPPPTLHLELGPLSPAACEELVTCWSSELAIELTPDLLENLVERSEGSPFLLQEFFRTYAHYAKRDRIAGDQWLYTDSENSVRRRFSLLPAESETVLQYLSIAEQPLGFHQLCSAARIPVENLQRTLSLLAAQGWIRSRTKALETDIEVAHEKIRKAVLKSMPTDRLQRRHFRMARMLSSEVPPPWSRMAYHYQSAERFTKAAACYLEAAHAALKDHAFKEALMFVERAEHEDADRSDSEKEAVRLLKAACLAGSGDSKAAAQTYDELAEGCSSEEERRVYLCRAGDQWIRAGDLDQCLEHVRPILKDWGIREPRRSLIPNRWFRYRMIWRALLQQRPKKSPSSAQPFTDLERCLLRTSFPLAFFDNQIGPELILSLNREAETHGADADRAIAGLHWGILLSLGRRKWRKQAAAWLRISRQLARNSNDAAALGAAHMCMHVWQGQRGNLRLAIRHAKYGLEWFALEPADRGWEQQFLRWAMLANFWHLMDFAQLRAETEEIRKNASMHVMAKYLTCIEGAQWADLIVDDAQGASQRLAVAEQVVPSRSFQTPRFFLWLSKTQQALYEGRFAAAHLILTTDWGELAKDYMLDSNHFRWLALTLRLCCCLTCLREQSGNAAWFRREARRAVKQMLKLEEPIFVAYGKAFGLLVEAACGQVSPQDQWQTVIDELHRRDHHLYAYGLSWHQSLYFPNSGGLRPQAIRQVFLDRGVVSPERLMDIVLPLPSVEHAPL